MLPEQLHGNTTVEIIWTADPDRHRASSSSASAWSPSARSRPAPRSRASRSRSRASSGNWPFRYDDGAEVVDPQGGEPPTLAVPVGEPIRLVLTSLDVNHAFYVPEFLIKRDLIDFGDEPAATTSSSSR